MPLARLPDRAVVRVSGEGAQKLLNDTLTCRFDDGLKAGGRWFALLSPQGKIGVEGLVTEADSDFWFDIGKAYAADFIKRMKLYRLRAKVDIEAVEDAAVLWSADPVSGVNGVAYRDLRDERIGFRAIARGAAPDAADDDGALAQARAAAGIMEMGADFAPNEMFPHDIGMDLLGGVDFKKGCYVGQEVVSRMQHRGTARRRPVIVTAVPAEAAAGSAVLAGGREAGVIGAPARGEAVGSLRLDRIGPGLAATVAGAAVSLALPGWATYAFGESAAAE